MVAWKVRPVRADEFGPWTRLFRGYADFYHWPTGDEHQHQIWGWIHDERRIEAFVAVPVDDAGNETGEPQGLAHMREWVRPLRGVICGYLDDLFVDPGHRGQGVVDAPTHPSHSRLGPQRHSQRSFDRTRTRAQPLVHYQCWRVVQ